MPSFHAVPSGGTYYCYGPENADEVMIFLGRANFAKDDQLVRNLLSRFAHNRSVIWYESRSASIGRLLGKIDRYAFIPRPLRKLFKALMLLRYPRYWNYFSPRYRQHISNDIGFYVAEFKGFIKRFGRRKIYVLTRSAGGRVASLVADELGISKIVCLGYPFQNPSNEVEPARYEHLAFLQTPFLIIQGTRDPYGGIDVPQRYQLSPQIKLSFFETDHDMQLSEGEWDDITAQIERHFAT